ncbi:uncharacterized protein LOC132748243 [Ruditapes philippinarum]|uniref:uncharacterized protein LOC132748243 n=1 Tax=Ruditapes philippinarum TaxID=129788 RepID=UPI00295B32D2|nr:uncharacterized protein LOC132748243 [Ruditapes philippinarum]
MGVDDITRNNVILMVFCLTISIVEIEVSADASESLVSLQSDFWDWRMRNNPTSSTYDGMYKYNDLMEEYSLEEFQTKRNKTLDFLARLYEIEQDDLDIHEKVNFDILKDTLETFTEGNLWAEYGALSPISFITGIQLFGGPSFAPSATRGDFENYIARLYAVQKQVDGIKSLGRRAISLNRTLHNVSMTKVPEQIDEKIFDRPENSSYYSPFGDFLDNSHVTNDSDRTYIRNRGKEAVLAYMNAFRDLKNFIVNEYMPNTRKEYGVYAWDPSNEYYKACLKWHLSFDMTPADVHDVGLKEVDRITKEMHKIMSSLGFEGTVAAFFASLEDDSRFYTNDTVKILKAYNDTVFKRINPVLENYFRDIPDIPLNIEAASYDGLGGGYSSASETSPGVFSINLFRPLEVPLFETMVLSLHEANPGHHLQNSFSLRADLPDFRKNPILSFADVPNWFPIYSAYMEGWGLYSEYLGEEMGMYKDGYEMMGRYSYEILRASRLVVDTGLHYMRWTREEAILYLQNHTALAGGSAANEIDRYITWPGQACAYKLGEIKIKELRQRAERELGDKFDLKEFHYQILANGGMPMSVLERIVNSWIDTTKQSKPTSGSPCLVFGHTLVSVYCFISILFSIISI